MDQAGPEVLNHCNTDLFLDGLDDLLKCTPSQHLVNHVARRLYRAWKTQHADSAPDRTLADLRRRMGAAFGMVVGKHLQTGLPDIWGGEDETLRAVAQAFEDALESGATVRFGRHGAEIEPL